MFRPLHEICPDFDGHVRLFPLPNHVLFPGNIDPLHIFEPRYCELLEHAIQGDQLIAMATIVDEESPEAADSPEGSTDDPKIARAVCIGRIVAHQANPNRTHDILLAGLARATIRRELMTYRLYREAFVDLLPDLPPRHDAPATRLQHSLIGTLENMTDSQANQEIITRLKGLDVGQVADVLAFVLPLSVPQKLKLLHEIDGLKRATTVAEFLTTTTQVGHNEGWTDFSLN